MVGTQLIATVFRSRSEIVHPTETVQLKAQFKDNSGTLVDLDTFPSVSIIAPDGMMVLSPTTAGVQRISTGFYQLDFLVNLGSFIGVYNDVWQGTVGGIPIEEEFSFIVSNEQYQRNQTDGYCSLGDDVGYNFSQVAIYNINGLLKVLKSRLRSNGRVPRPDPNNSNNIVYVDCSIFSTSLLVDLLVMSLSNFNLVPHFTSFTWESDPSFFLIFGELVIEGAYIYALAGQALLEAGRNYSISDAGLVFTPPTVGDMLNSQYGTTLTAYNEKLKYTKSSMKPSSISLGSYSVTTGTNPAIRRLRFLRERQII